MCLLNDIIKNLENKFSKIQKEIPLLNKDINSFIKMISNRKKEYLFNKTITNDQDLFKHFISNFKKEQECYNALYNFYNENIYIYKKIEDFYQIIKPCYANFPKNLERNLNLYLNDITISYKDKKINEEIKDYINKTKFIEKIHNLCKQSSIYGKAYVVFYYNKNINKPDFRILNPSEFLLVKSNNSKKNILGIHEDMFNIKKNKTTSKIRYKIYTQDKIYQNFDNKTEFIEQNSFKYLGISELKENDFSEAIFEPCIDSIIYYNYYFLCYAAIKEIFLKDNINISIENYENYLTYFYSKKEELTEKIDFIEQKLEENIYKASECIVIFDYSINEYNNFFIKRKDKKDLAPYLNKFVHKTKQKKHSLKEVIKDIFDIYFSYYKKIFNKDSLNIEIKS